MKYRMNAVVYFYIIHMLQISFFKKATENGVCIICELRILLKFFGVVPLT